MDLMWFCMDSIYVDCYGFEYGFIVSAPWGVRWELVYGVPTIGADWLTLSRLTICSNRDNAVPDSLRLYSLPVRIKYTPVLRICEALSLRRSNQCWNMPTRTH